jgi:competence protein ComEC
MLPDLYPLPLPGRFVTLAGMAGQVRGLGLRRRLVGFGRRLGAAVAGLRQVDLAETLLAERDRWFLWLPVLLGAGIAGYFLLPAEPALPLLRWAISLLLLAVFLLSWRRAAWRIPFLALLAVLAGPWLAAERTLQIAAPVLQRSTGAVWIEGRVREAEERDNGYRILLDRLVIGSLADREMPQRIRITLRRDGDTLWPGQRIRIRAMLSPPPEPAMPGAYDFARAAWFQQIGAVGYALSGPDILRIEPPADWRDAGLIALSSWRQDISRRLAETAKGAGGAIAIALMTGERGPIPDGVDRAFRDSGLAHILSISGLHLTLVAGLLFFVVRALLALSPRLALHYPIKKWAAAIALAGAIAYTLLSGAGLPTLRSLVMIALALLAVLLDRRAITLRSVAWAALALLVLWPESLLDPGFQMSFAAVTALVAGFELWGPRVAAWRAAADGSPWRLALLWLFGTMAASFVAGSGSSFFAAYHFNRVADYALIANLLATPLVSFWIMPLGMLAFLLMPLGLEHLALIPMVWGVDLLIDIAQWVARWPGAVGYVPAMPVWGLAGIAFGGLWLCLWRRAWRWFGLVGLAAGSLSPWLRPLPDLVVAADGRMIAARAADGVHYYLSGSMPPRSFAGQIWWQRLGGPPLYPWPALRRGDTEGRSGADGAARCDSDGCAWRHDGFLVALPVRPQAITEDCRHADTVIARQLAVRYRCPAAKVVIDRFDVRREGTHMLFLDREAGLHVATVAQSRGLRPWTMRRAPGRSDNSDTDNDRGPAADHFSVSP